MDSARSPSVCGPQHLAGADDTRQKVRGKPQGVSSAQLGLNVQEHERLRLILADMDLPALRVETLDKTWLLRNIAINNWKHADLREAVTLLKKL